VQEPPASQRYAGLYPPHSHGPSSHGLSSTGSMQTTNFTQSPYDAPAFHRAQQAQQQQHAQHAHSGSSSVDAMWGGRGLQQPGDGLGGFSGFMPR
jgi:hypothetical protein